MPTKEQLKDLQSKSLEEKIQISTARIIEWYEHWNGQVYVSFSGGKDSTVLLDLVRRFYPDVPCVFLDTGLEYPEIRDFVKTKENVTWLKPEMNFRKVIDTYGYPIISKNVAAKIRENRSKPNGYTKTMFEGSGEHQNDLYNLSKYKYLIDSPFKISNECCNIMKKRPAHKYDKETGKHPFIATMTSESKQRKNNWIKQGCNAFDNKNPSSQPMSFWTEQDVLEYIKTYEIPYASVYGDIVIEQNGKLNTTGLKRTGCIFCGFGCHLEKEPNRFQRLEETHPKLYSYCINGGEYNEDGVWIPSTKGLGMGKVLDYIGVDYKPINKNQDKE